MKLVQIGIGGWGKNHIRHLSSIGNLVAICDVDEEKVKQYAHEYECLPYNDVDKMVRSCDFDIAFVTTPTSTHYDIAKLLMENGKHVFVEKPFTDDLSQGNELIRIAEKNNVKLTCGYIERFNPVTQFIKNISDVPILLEFHRESKIPTHIKDTGIVLDTMVHDIDTACHIFGSYPHSVKAVSHNVRGGKNEDISVAILSFPENRIASLVSNWNTNSKMRTIHAAYSNGIIRGDFVKKDVKIIEIDRVITPDIKQHDPLHSELLSFINAVQLDKEPDVTAEHANHVTQIAMRVLNEQ